MSFKFTKSDDFESLDPAIKAHVPGIIKNRIQEFEDKKEFFINQNFEEISRYCHNVEGVAVCYGLFKLDEIIRHIHQLSKSGDSDQIKSAYSTLSDYFDSLK